MLRYILLRLSQNKPLRRWFEQAPPSKRLTSRFIAGRTLDDAVRAIQGLQQAGMLAAIDYLGENVTRADEAAACRERYLETLRVVQQHNLEATVSLKLTQFGLDLGRDLCVDNVCTVAEFAQAIGSRVEIDMEGSAYTQQTLDVIRQVHAKYPGAIRAVLQAYLRRTESDIADLSALGIPIRLCKGAYRESSDIAFPKKSQVDASFVRLMHQLLQNGTYPAIATHDERIIRDAIAFVRQHAIASEAFEFEMLYGIRRDLQRELASLGLRLRVYVPFGNAWYPYFVRRLAERPANLLFLLRNLAYR